jgi:hypothetical protein
MSKLELINNDFLLDRKLNWICNSFILKHFNEEI